MLAERSTRIVSSGLPGGGGIRSNHVGFEQDHQRHGRGQRPSASRQSTTFARASGGVRPRRTSASSAAVARARGTHIASGMQGSKVMCVIGLPAYVRKISKAEVSPKMHATHATANHFQRSSRRWPSSSRRDRRPCVRRRAGWSSTSGGQHLELAFFGRDVDGRRRRPSRRRARRGRRPAAPATPIARPPPRPRRPVRRNRRRWHSAPRRPARGFAEPAAAPASAGRWATSGSPQSANSAARCRSSICSTSSASNGTKAEVLGRFDAAEVGVDHRQHAGVGRSEHDAGRAVVVGGQHVGVHARVRGGGS